MVWAGAGAAVADGDGDAGGAAGADSTGTARAEEERAKKATREERMVVFILLELFRLSWNYYDSQRVWMNADINWNPRGIPANIYIAKNPPNNSHNTPKQTN